MFKKVLPLLAVAPFIAGCYIVAPFPGGYVAFDIPPLEVNVSNRISVNWGLIPGTAIYYSSEYPNVHYYGGSYYYVVNGAWYIGSHYSGPWRMLRSVPDVFLYIPPTHPSFHIVSWHPHYHSVYKNMPPGHRYSAPAPGPSTPTVPVKGKPGKDETAPPPAPPVPPGHFIRK